jgi:hypothetical protein
MSGLDEEVLEDEKGLRGFSGRSRGREDYTRAGLMAFGALTASYAAVDQYLEGNTEVGDHLGHISAGMASSLALELGYHRTGLDDSFESDFPKYAMMIGAAALGGSAIELGQFYGGIPGGLDMESYMQTLQGGLGTTLLDILGDMELEYGSD